MNASGPGTSSTNAASGKIIRVAIYARVSSDKQAQQQTIASQIAALEGRITADGFVKDDELCFIDDGVSGTTLLRPSLERLRDIAHVGGFQRLYVHSPDRLARRYAYQVLLVEELRRVGVEIVFLNRAIGVSPEEDMLLQMQGIFAEYERAKILERSRRGKRHAAQSGSVSVLSGAPYGYRYMTKNEGTGTAAYVIDSEQAAVVKQIFEWIGPDRLSIGEVCRRLKERGIPSPKGKAYWDRTSVWGLLKNPAFCGRAAYGKTCVGERRARVRPARGQSSTPRRSYSIYDAQSEEHVTITVPALISEELFAAVQEQLAANRQSARERKGGAKYLLQGLVECGCCGYAYYGKKVSRASAKGKTPYAYYRCIGSDAYRFGGKRICENTQVRTDLIDEAVWRDARELLRNPELLREEYQRRLQPSPEDTVRERTLRQQEQATERAISRLIDAYANGLLEKEEFEPRLEKARTRLTTLRQNIAGLKERETEQAHIREMMSCLDDFTARIGSGLDAADWSTRREILRLLVRKVSLEPESVRITYRISFPLFLKRVIQVKNDKSLHFCWRSDDASLRGSD